MTLCRLPIIIRGMIETEIEVTNPKGIHARPSSLLVNTAREYQSRITLSLGEYSTAADDIMGILSLGALCGDTLKVTVQGPDEEEALRRLREIFALNFNDN